MYVLQRRGSGRDTLSYGMADKDTHPHHYPSPPPPLPPLAHSLPSVAAPPSSSAASLPLSRHRLGAHHSQVVNLKPQQHNIANPRPVSTNLRPPQQNPHAGAANHRAPPLAGGNLKHGAPAQQNLAKAQLASRDLAGGRSGVANQRPIQHGRSQSSSIQQSVETRKAAAQGSVSKPVTKARSLRDDDSSPKKKQLKLILKLRKPNQDGQDGPLELPPPPQGVRSKAPASNGVASRALGSSTVGSSGVSSLSGGTRSKNAENRLGDGTTAGATAAAGGSMELRQRSAVAVTTSASASESMDEEQHSSRKRKVRDAPERKGEEEKVAAPAGDGGVEDGPRRRMKLEKDVRFVPTPTLPGQLQSSSPPYRFLEELLERFQKKDTYGVFAEPVDPEEIPDYLDIIKEPMDFSTIKKKLAKGAYDSIDLFERDVNLICSNAMKYNAPRTIYYKQAKAIKDIARKAFDALRGRLNGQKRGPGKQSKMKRCTTKRTFEQQSTDGAVVGAATVDGKKASTIDRVADLSHKSNSPFQSSGNDYEYPEGSLSKAPSLKDGRRLLAVDENRRNTYRPPESSLDDVVVPHLVPIGLQSGGSYAQSLALFGANFKRPAWEFVARKIRKVLAPNVPFGPGWVGEQTAPESVAEEMVTDETKDLSQAAAEVVSSTAHTGIFSSSSAATVGVPVQAPFRPLTGSSPSLGSSVSAPNGLFSVSDARTHVAARSAESSRNVESSIKQFREANPQQITSSEQRDPTVQQPGPQKADQHPLRQAEGNSHLFRNLEAGRGPEQLSRKQDVNSQPGRGMDANTQHYRNVEAIAQQLREASSQQLRKADSGHLQHQQQQQQQQHRDSLPKGDNTTQQARSAMEQQLRAAIDVNSQQVRDSSSQQARNSIDINFQQQRSRNSTEQVLRNGLEHGKSSIDVNSQQPRKPDATVQHLRSGGDANQFARFALQRDHTAGAAENRETSRYPKFGPNGSIGFPGMEASRGAWSLQRALAQDSSARDSSGGLQRVFGQEHANSGRSSADAGAFPSPISAAAFQNLAAYNSGSGNAGMGQLFGLPGVGSQGVMPKQAPVGSQVQQQAALRPDMNATSAEFFRQQSEYHQKEHLQQQQVQMGVYNAISQSLLQPWKNQRFQQQQQQQQAQQHQHQHQHQHQLRPLPPDLNVRLQSPKSPQHHAQAQQHHLQHQQQQQQHQQQLQQQPDLALQL